MSFFKKMVDKFEDLLGDDDKKKAEEKKAEEHKVEQHEGTPHPAHQDTVAASR